MDHITGLCVCSTEQRRQATYAGLQLSASKLAPALRIMVGIVVLSILDSKLYVHYLNTITYR